ncbi:transcriptional regulatory protein ZraR [bacterium BMS3Abin07]|nr:transcriptional regulatory protein ZraR [bacterium BMS3Abin07]GBE31255.1 transcriptional regulatory protein ZraR [bacterium BMS3Bbin05]
MKVLIIEDDETLNRILLRALRKEFFVDGFTSPVKALNVLEKNFYDVVVSDIKMPDFDGLTVLERVKKISPETEVILITGFGTVEESVCAVKRGAYDYILKPVDAYHLISKLGKIKELKQHQHIEVENLTIICEDLNMRKVMDLAEKVAEGDTTVLLTGETGTGKEVIARFIHSQSKRNNNLFVDINCSNIQENLFESELFGFEKGAFTGAEKSRRGFVELASGGTLFLDEITEMPLRIQPKFLRFIEERSVYRLGGERKITTDVRIIAATNRNLEEEVKEGAFREDLYYRLHVFGIHMPPLRTRPKDIEALTYYFIRKFNSLNPCIKGITEDAFLNLKNYSFPGNVRELSNLIERAMIIEKGNMITLESLTYMPFKNIEIPPGKLDNVIKDHILQVIEMAEGDKSRASEILGIDRSTLYRKLKEYGFL